MTELQQLACTFTSEMALYMAYMPFVKNGGIFIRTNQNYSFDSEIELSLTLLDEQEPFQVKGKIIWITPKDAQGDKFQGIGVQFVSDNYSQVTNTIEKHLAGMLNSTQSTDTI